MDCPAERYLPQYGSRLSVTASIHFLNITLHENLPARQHPDAQSLVASQVDAEEQYCSHAKI